MKKFMSILIVFIFFTGCSKSEEDKIKEYVKEDLVVENGSKINTNSIFDLTKSNSITKLIKTGKVTIDYKDNKISDEITDDKIIGTNDVNFTYTKNDEEKSINFETKIKDTIKPKVESYTKNIYSIENNMLTAKELIKKVKVKISDASNTKISISNYTDINFSKSGNYKLALTITDIAGNTANITSTLHIQKEAKVLSFPVNIEKNIELGGHKTPDATFNLVFPSSIATKYTITTSKKYDKYVVNGYRQDIYLKSKDSTINIYFSNAIPEEYYGDTLNKYTINKFKVFNQLLNGEVYYMAFTSKYYFSLKLHYYGNISNFEVNDILREILINSYIN